MRLGDRGYRGRKEPEYSKEGNGLYSSSKKPSAFSNDDSRNRHRRTVLAYRKIDKVMNNLVRFL